MYTGGPGASPNPGGRAEQDEGEGEGLPAYSAPLSVRVVSSAAEHERLSTRLDELSAVAGELGGTMEAVFAARGRVVVQRRQLLTLEGDLGACQRVRPWPWSRGRRGRREAAAAAVGAQRALLAGTEEEVARLAARQAELEVLSGERERLATALAALHAALFSPAGESRLRLLEHTARLLRAEAQREHRARPLLTALPAPLAALTADLQSALALSTATGIPSNTKYSRQLFVNGHTALVKSATPLLLTAKTHAASFHTSLANARALQPYIGTPPPLAILPLHLMPGQRSPNALDERGLHASLERSYAQARAVHAYLRTELNRSHERSRKLAAELNALQQDLAHEQHALTAQRRALVTTIAADPSLPTHTIIPPHPPPEPELRAQATARLRQILERALGTPDSEEDDDPL